MNFDNTKLPVYLDYDHEPNKFVYRINGITKKSIEYFYSLDKFKNLLTENTTEENKYSILNNSMFNTEIETSHFRDPIKGEPFYYPINMTWFVEQNINLIIEHLIISKYIIQQISLNRCKIIIYSSWESPTRNDFLYFIESIIKKYPTIQKKNFVVLTNNLEVLYDNDDKMLSSNFQNIKRVNDITFICHSFFMTVGYKSWQRITYDSEEFTNRLNKSIKKIKNKIPRPYKFICLHRRPRSVRWFAALYLYPDRKQGLLSFTLDLDINPIHGNYQNFNASIIQDYRRQVHKMITSIESNEVNESMDQFEIWSQKYLSTVFPKNDIRRSKLDNIFEDVSDRFYNSNFIKDIPLFINDSVDPRSNPVSDMAFDKYFDSYLHIVSETEVDFGFEENRFKRKYWLTEKIFKPIWCMQPFVLICWPGALAHLKNLGFKTFDKYIDESYDLEPNAHRRIVMALHSAKQFYNRPHEQILADYNDMLDILQHNRNLLLKKASRLNNDIKNDLMHALSDCVWNFNN